jgi:predicted DNA-binding protein (MmcQ/YjbR family)
VQGASVKECRETGQHRREVRVTGTEAREYVLAQRGAEGGYPFGPGAFVVKVGGKMFALLAEDEDPMQLSLKVDPAEGEVLREQYPAIRPGYHLNKRHWVTVTLDGSVPDDLLHGLVDDSYALVVRSLTRSAREALAATA